MRLGHEGSKGYDLGSWPAPAGRLQNRRMNGSVQGLGVSTNHGMTLSWIICNFDITYANHASLCTIPSRFPVKLGSIGSWAASPDDGRVLDVDFYQPVQPVQPAASSPG